MSHRGSDIQTPAFDRIASEGVSFARSYVQPLCTPTRAALLTGRMPVRFGLQYRPLRPWDNHGLPQSEELLSEVLQNAGYTTACVGKWHLGHGKPEHHPLSRGFDSFYGLITGAHDYFSHQRGTALDWQRDGQPLIEEGYSTDLLGDEAARIILEHTSQTKPLFLYLPFNAPHTPLQAPDELVAKYAKQHGERRAVYMAMVESMDSAINKVLSALDESGQSENTIVLFLNDNGGARIEGASNKPLRGGKGSALEGGIRVPALMRWPNQIDSGIQSQQLITAQDWMPTLLASAGIASATDFDGINLLENIKGNQSPIVRNNLFFGTISEKGWYLALIDDDYKYIRRTLHSGKQTEKLYQLSSDPSEQLDLSQQQPQQVERLRKLALKWHALSPNGIPEMVTEAPVGWELPSDWSEASRP